MAALRTIDTNLVHTSHVIVHRFPHPASGKLRRRSFGDCLHNGEDPRSDGATVEIRACRNGATAVVIGVTLEQMNAPGFGLVLGLPQQTTMTSPGHNSTYASSGLSLRQ